MAVMTYRQDDVFLGTLTNGVKLVETVVVGTGTGTDATTIYPGATIMGSAPGGINASGYIGIFKQIIDFVPSYLTAGVATQPRFTLTSAAGAGAIVMLPGASHNGKAVQFIVAGV